MSYRYHTASKKILGDLNTPVSTYMKLRDDYPMSALMECSDYHGGENSKSFIGVHPIASVSIEHGKGICKFPDGTQTEHEITKEYGSAQLINDFLSVFEVSGDNAAYCGLFGYTSFNAVRYFENINVKDETQEKNDAPDLLYILYKDVVVFDHFCNEMVLIELLADGEQDDLDVLERDINNRKFNWQFSNVGEGYYEGNKDGTLDTSKLQFNEAFKRSMYETSRQICLDFRDSNTTLVTEAFYLRHRAEEVCRTIYFRKAWRNLSGTDTVVEKSTFTVPPVLTTVGTNPLIAYMKGATVIGSKYHNGTEWVNIDASNISITSGDTITKIAIANNGTDAYLAVLTKSGKLNAYKSASGTSTWSIVGNQVTDAKFADIAVSSSNPVLLYIKADNKPQIATLNGNSWKSSKISDKGAREIKGAYTSNGKLIIVYVGNTSNYQGYYAIYDGSTIEKDKTIVANMSGVDIAIDVGNIYIAFSSRDTESYGPIVKKGTLHNDNKSIDFDGASQFTRSFTEGKLIHGVSVAAREGNVFAIIDDNSRVALSQSHAFHLDGNTWKVYGENELPYFKVTFYNSHHYYLRGYAPDISIASDGKVFISMLAWENAHVGENNTPIEGDNYGPLVMKYVADTWTVH